MNNLKDRFLQLKQKHNVVVLAHYYQKPEIQDLADFLGDSLALAQAAQRTKADTILFCGVGFMAETAKILNPDKLVLLPDKKAGCSLAESAPPDKFSTWIAKHPGSVVISYINCSIEVKAQSDLICTSANAVKIVESVPREKKILFAPDKYLGSYIIKKTGREMELWPGTCQVHEAFSKTNLIKLKNQHPEAEVLAHPECRETILELADYIGSTTGIIKYSQASQKRAFIVATEPGVIHQMTKNNPEKTFIPLPDMMGANLNVCPHMRINSLDKMVKSLETLEPQINLPEDLRLRALKPLSRMLEIS